MRQPAEPDAAPFAGPAVRAGPGTEPAGWVVDGVEVGRVMPRCEVVVHCGDGCSLTILDWMRTEKDG